MRFVYHNCCVNQRDREVLINFEREDVSVPEDWRPTLEWTTESGEKHLDNKLDMREFSPAGNTRKGCLAFKLRSPINSIASCFFSAGTMSISLLQDIRRDLQRQAEEAEEAAGSPAQPQQQHRQAHPGPGLQYQSGAGASASTSALVSAGSTSAAQRERGEARAKMMGYTGASYPDMLHHKGELASVILVDESEGEGDEEEDNESVAPLASSGQGSGAQLVAGLRKNALTSMSAPAHLVSKNGIAAGNISTALSVGPDSTTTSAGRIAVAESTSFPSTSAVPRLVDTRLLSRIAEEDPSSAVNRGGGQAKIVGNQMDHGTAPGEGAELRVRQRSDESKSSKESWESGGEQRSGEVHELGNAGNASSQTSLQHYMQRFGANNGNGERTPSPCYDWDPSHSRTSPAGNVAYPTFAYDQGGWGGLSAPHQNGGGGSPGRQHDADAYTPVASAATGGAQNPYYVIGGAGGGGTSGGNPNPGASGADYFSFSTASEPPASSKSTNPLPPQSQPGVLPLRIDQSAQYHDIYREYTASTNALSPSGLNPTARAYVPGGPTTAAGPASRVTSSAGASGGLQPHQSVPLQSGRPSLNRPIMGGVREDPTTSTTSETDAMSPGAAPGQRFPSHSSSYNGNAGGRAQHPTFVGGGQHFPAGRAGAPGVSPSTSKTSVNTNGRVREQTAVDYTLLNSSGEQSSSSTAKRKFSGGAYHNHPQPVVGAGGVETFYQPLSRNQSRGAEFDQYGALSAGRSDHAYRGREGGYNGGRSSNRRGDGVDSATGDHYDHNFYRGGTSSRGSGGPSPATGYHGGYPNQSSNSPPMGGGGAIYNSINNRSNYGSERRSPPSGEFPKAPPGGATTMRNINPPPPPAAVLFPRGGRDSAATRQPGSTALDDLRTSFGGQHTTRTSATSTSPPNVTSSNINPALPPPPKPPKRQPPDSDLMREFKEKTRQPKLSEIGASKAIADEFLYDQLGSRYIQEQLAKSAAQGSSGFVGVHESVNQHTGEKTTSPMDLDFEKQILFERILPEAPRLVYDVFGNYVVQKYFEHGTDLQREELVDILLLEVKNLCFQLYGCRVIQTALDYVSLDLKRKICRQIKHSVVDLVEDQNGNHVLQKCIEVFAESSAADLQFIVDAFSGNVRDIAGHRYGCRVIQRIIECVPMEQTAVLFDEMLSPKNLKMLAHHRYGNYVVQFMMERGRPQDVDAVYSGCAQDLKEWSCHKFASNIVEKVLDANMHDRKKVEHLLEILTQGENPPLIFIMKDKFGNYICQKFMRCASALEAGNKLRDDFFLMLKAHLPELSRLSYGKHILFALKEKGYMSEEEVNQALLPS